MSLHTHQKEHDRIVKHILHCVAKDICLPKPVVVKRFIQLDSFVTEMFWLSMFDYSGNDYIGVNYCHTCKRFNLITRQSSLLSTETVDN